MNLGHPCHGLRGYSGDIGSGRVCMCVFGCDLTRLRELTSLCSEAIAAYPFAARYCTDSP